MRVKEKKVAERMSILKEQGVPYIFVVWSGEGSSPMEKRSYGLMEKTSASQSEIHSSLGRTTGYEEDFSARQPLKSDKLAYGKEFLKLESETLEGNVYAFPKGTVTACFFIVCIYP
ncbi:hypothetical protein DPX16_16218 [Anabarilius grahami]|uniref:Uncharacterized protein n=1 Tax=Anabarilius grahami TaxID=495550 RepID=A0A3N0XH98_ANAGA|nr:hypothetical protein DPX16_16218 [Anabarilius grahami]